MDNKNNFVEMPSSDTRTNSPEPVKICDYLALGCNVNSRSVLQGMKDAGMDVSHAQVLYLTYFEYYNRHFVVRYGNYIYDAEIPVSDEEKLQHRSHLVQPIPVKDYFSERHADHDAKIRVIPGSVYLNSYSGAGFDYFLRFEEVPLPTYLGNAM